MTVHKKNQTTTTSGHLADADAVAARFRVTAASVRKCAREGKIPSFKAGTVYRFDLAAVEEALRVTGRAR